MTEDSEPIRIRARAIIFGMILIVPIARWLFEGEMVRYTFTTWAAPFYNAVFVLFWVTVINFGLGRVLRKPPFNSLELLALYTMVSIASALLSTDLLGILVTMMGYPTHFANPTNDWAHLFTGALPTWLYVTDERVLTGFYEGNSNFWTVANFFAWLKPALIWTVFITALFTSFLALSVLVRKQWVEAERLTFPIIQLPLAMTQSPGSFFSNRLMWLGFVISGAITFVNGMHYLSPNWPYIAIQRHNLPLFTAPPWNAVPSVKISFYFFAITLGFLMPLDLSVSLWGFFFLYLGQIIAAQGLGYDAYQDFYLEDQAFGAYLTIGIFVLWSARGHLLRTLRTAIGRDKSGYDRDEPISYRSAWIALFASLVVMVVFMKLAGASPGIAAASLFILMMLAIVITRIRAELGFPVHDLHQMGPHGTLIRLVGTENISRHSLGAIATFFWDDRVFRSHPMPHQLEGLKMAAESRQAGRDMLRAILIAGLFAIPVTFCVYLDGFYRLGASTARVGPWGTGYAAEIFSSLERWIRSPEKLAAGHWGGMAVGMAVTSVLMLLRVRFLGFPLHPLGYAVANSWGVWQLWLPIMIGSLSKAAVLKAGGLQTYRKAMMFFFGLMLGEFVVGCAWTVGGMLFGARTYDFWPG